VQRPLVRLQQAQPTQLRVLELELELQGPQRQAQLWHRRNRQPPLPGSNSNCASIDRCYFSKRRR